MTTARLDTLELMRLYSPPRACSYLPTETASLAYRIIFQIDAAGYEGLLARGWRRHGCHFFRPACPSCRQCKSLRVDVLQFQPTKSQRRCLRRNADVRLEIAEPAVTEAHLRLFNAYHADMRRRRGWSHKRVDAEEYFESFLVGTFEFAREFRFVRDGQLVGVSLVDQTAHGVSSVYYYHDPAWRDDGPGTFTILKEIEYARQTHRLHYYLGYWISECPSMSYKSRFGPHEMLDDYPSDHQWPDWH